MRDQFDISGVFETTEFEIAQVACISNCTSTCLLLTFHDFVNLYYYRGVLYKGSFDCLMKSLRNEGITVLMKGFWPTYARLVKLSILKKTPTHPLTHSVLVIFVQNPYGRS